MAGKSLTNSIRSRLCHLVVLALAFFSSGHASAKLSTPESCDFVDLRSQLGPVRDQGDIGWCYANSAADLLTAKFKTAELGYMSADQLAIIYNNARGSSLSAQSGVTADTLKIALRIPGHPATTAEFLSSGFCPFSLEAEAFKMGPQTSLTTKLDRLKELKSLFDLGKTQLEKNQQFWSTYRSYIQQKSVLEKIPQALFLRALEKSTPENFLLYFADLLCGSERSYNSNPAIAVVEHTKQITWTFSRASAPICSATVNLDLLSEIHHELKAKNNILSATIDSSLIQIDGDLDRPEGGHAVTVVGRQWRNGSCQLLLRNSWGTACEFRNQQGRLVSAYSKYVQKCEAGNLWVNENDFYRALTSITYLTESDNGQDPNPPKAPSTADQLCTMAPRGQ